MNFQKIIVQEEAPECISLQNLISDDGTAYPTNVTFDMENDVLTLPYSSGTTGVPKGVMLTHRNIMANFAMLE